MKPSGLLKENWPIGIAVILGILVVGIIAYVTIFDTSNLTTVVVALFGPFVALLAVFIQQKHSDTRSMRRSANALQSELWRNYEKASTLRDMIDGIPENAVIPTLKERITFQNTAFTNFEMAGHHFELNEKDFEAASIIEELYNTVEQLNDGLRRDSELKPSELPISETAAKRIKYAKKQILPILRIRADFYIKQYDRLVETDFWANFKQ